MRSCPNRCLQDTAETAAPTQILHRHGVGAGGLDCSAQLHSADRLLAAQSGASTELSEG